MFYHHHEQVLLILTFSIDQDGETEYLWIAFAAALGTFFLYPQIPDAFDSGLMEAVDAWSLGAFAVIGMNLR